jgi:hypothetical protein
MMLWIRAHQRTWRTIILVLLLIAIIGPWAFDLINVPSIYPCLNSVRLEGDFCGIPLSGARAFTFFIEAVVGSVSRLIMGEGGIRLEFRNIRAGIFMVLIFLPLLSMLIVIIRGNSRRFRWSHILILGLAIPIVSMIAFSGFLRPSGQPWALWGIWLYLGLLLSVLFLEVLNHLETRKLKLAG